MPAQWPVQLQLILHCCAAGLLHAETMTQHISIYTVISVVRAIAAEWLSLCSVKGHASAYILTAVVQEPRAGQWLSAQAAMELMHVTLMRPLTAVTWPSV